MKLDIKSKVGLILGAGTLVIGGVAWVVHRRYSKGKRWTEVSNHRSVTLPQVYEEIVVPADHVSAFFGPRMERLKALEADSNTAIQVKDGPDLSKLCIVRGTAGNVAVAVHLIKDFLVHNVVKIEDVFTVPSKAVGRIMGEKGSRIEELRKQFPVEINFGKHCGEPETLVTIRGFSADVASAKAKVLELVADDPRHFVGEKEPPSSPSLAITSAEQPTMRVSVEKGAWATLGVFGSDHPVEVLVSCIDPEGPSRFWVHMSGPRTADLDKLSSRLDEMMQDAENEKAFGIKINDLKECDVVAVQADDCHWYRGLICDVRRDDYGGDEAHIDVMYVDYGRTESLIVSNLDVRRLQPEFLELQFQAIECSLAGVVRCEKDASKQFAKLANLGTWKPVTLIQVGKKERLAKFPIRDEPYEVPLVRLINNDSGTPFDIGARLAEEDYIVLSLPGEDERQGDTKGRDEAIEEIHPEAASTSAPH